jgi:hypothetical protein
MESKISYTGGSAERKYLLATLIAVAAALGVWLAAAGSYANPWDHNEGVYLNSARLVLRGHALFGEVFSSQPPLFVSSLAASLHLLGDRPESARIFMALVAVAGLAAMAFLSWNIFGAGAAPWTVVAAATSYLFSRGGHFAEADLPAAALALISMSAAMVAARRHSMLWAAVAGIIYAGAIMTKVLVVPWLLAALLLLLPAAAGHGGSWWSGFAARLVAFAAGLAIGLVAVLLAFGAHDVISQAFLFHFSKRGSTSPSSPLTANLAMMAQYFGRDIGVAVLAALGIAHLAAKKTFGALWLAALMGASFAFGLYHTPLSPNHLIPITCGAAFAAGVGAAVIVALLRRAIAPVLAAFAVLLMSQISVDAGVPGVGLPGGMKITLSMLRNNSKFLHVDLREEDLRIMRYLRSHTEEDELVVSDGHKAVYWAGRASPPFLCDLTRERIESGWLTDEDLIRHSSGVNVVVIQTGQLDRFPRFKEWLVANYDAVAQASSSARIYRRR